VPHRACDLDAAALQYRHPVGEALRLVQVVGGEHDRLAERAEVLDRRPAPAARLRVEAGRRLVEEDQVRVAGQGEGQVKAAALTAGQAAHLDVPVLGELHDLQQVGQVPRFPVVAAPAVDELRHPGLPREAAFLQDDADPLAEPGRLRPRVHAEDADRPAGPLPKAFEYLDGGGLACAVGAEQAEDLARLDLEVDALEHPAVRVAHREAADLDRGAHGRSSLPRCCALKYRGGTSACSSASTAVSWARPGGIAAP
jgi:hypothetical protein